MKITISNLKNLLTPCEQLSTQDLCQLKGGGEDLRRKSASANYSKKKEC